MKVATRFRELRSLCCRGTLYATTLAMAFFLTAHFARAQSTGGRIRCTVTDPSGGAGPAANVTLINEANHTTRDVQSGANGEYVFPQKPVGCYQIDDARHAFNKYTRQR